MQSVFQEGTCGVYAQAADLPVNATEIGEGYHIFDDACGFSGIFMHWFFKCLK